MRLPLSRVARAWLVPCCLGVVVASCAEEAAEADGRERVSEAAHALYLSAQEAATAGEHATARDFARRALDEAPQSAVISSFLGMMHMHLGERADAITAFEQAVVLDAELHPEVRAAFVAALMAEGRREDAYVHVQRQAELHPNDLASQVVAQDFGLSLGRWEEVQAAAESRLLAEPEAATARYLAARLEADPSRKVERLADVLAVEPGHVAARQDWMGALLQARDLTALDAACDDAPNHGLDPFSIALMRSRAALLRGAADEARRHADDAVAAEPRWLDGHLAQVAASLAQRDFEAARTACDAAAGTTGGDPLTTLYLEQVRVQTWLEEGALDEAERHLELLRPQAKSPEAKLIIQSVEQQLAWRRGEEPSPTITNLPRVVTARASWTRLLLRHGMRLAWAGNVEAARACWSDAADAKVVLPHQREEQRLAEFLVGRASEEATRDAMTHASLYADNDLSFAVGIAHEMAGQVDDAVAAYRQCVDVSVGDDFPAHLARRALVRLTQE